MNKLRLILCPVLALLLCACQTVFLDGPQAESALRVSLDNVSAEVSCSKAIPAELGKPSVSDFNVKVVRNSNGAVVFDGKLGEKETLVKVAPDEPYTVTATCGANYLLAMNSPYYVGTAVASAAVGEKKNVNVECKVGNSLISARFGSDEAGRERFAKYFSSCSLDVTAGDFVVNLPMNGEGVSAYLRSGSDYSVSFSGIIKSTGEKRSFDLSSENIPLTLNPAEHLVITLDMKVETGVDITISKAEIQDINLDQTIPFSWLPMPTFVSQHVFDANGILVGTDLSCSASYPGCTWHAYVRNSAGTLVRTLSGKDALKSSYSSSEDWPYLPSGTYTATFSYEYDGKTVNIDGKKRTFTIGSPEGIKATASGFTSYDKYKSGSVSVANTCNGFMLYDVALSLGISTQIKLNGNYKNIISATSGSVWVDQNTGKKNFTGTAIGTFNSLSAGNHSCNLSFTFDGASSAASFSFLITGLPVSFTPPTEGAGWKGHGTVKFENDYVQLGRDAWSQPHYIDYYNISVPMGTKVTASYDVNPHGATVQTTLSLYFGDIEYFSKKSSYMSDSRESGSKTFLTSSDVTMLKANSSYGSGATRSYVYSLSFEYAE